MPKKVSFAGIIFEYDEVDQMYINDEYKNICDYAFLNDEVEIIEEEKEIPEKLEEKYYHDEPALIDDMAHKINEIIDYLKSKGE